MENQFLQLKTLLDRQVKQYNNPDFIPGDPISIPHQYTKLQDIEITAFWTAIFSWGQRKTIIQKANELFSLLDDSPFDFIMHHQEADLKKILNFKHRTFNTTDTLYFIHFFKSFYSKHHSLEEAFSPAQFKRDTDVRNMIIAFHNLFFSLEYFPHRTKKHVPSPANNSTCKRINMFLRWMVRSDNCGVDFGLWKQISPAQLVCPLDVHVERVARKMNLITRRQTDWYTAIELTEKLKTFDPADPVKYDFALFSLGVLNKMA